MRRYQKYFLVALFVMAAAVAQAQVEKATAKLEGEF